MPGEPPSSTSEPGHEAAAEHAVELADAGRRRATCGRLRPRASGTGFSAAAAGGRATAPRGRRGARPPRRACSTRRSRGSARATWRTRAPQAEQTKTVAERAIHQPKGARWTALAPGRNGPLQSVRPARLHRPRCDLLDQPVAAAEFLAVDTETNGRGGDLCELTEVGAVLVGGGELHDDWESLVRVERPLSRGIERFTGITQAMVDAAPPPAEVLPELARAARRAACWWPTTPASTAACCARPSSAAASTGPTRPCSARWRWRAASRRWCASAGWPRWPTRSGSRSSEVHRALPDAAHLRAGASARCSRGCAPTRRRSATRVELLRARAGGRARPSRARAASRRRTGPTCPRCRTTRACTCSATSAGGRCTWASRCRCARARGRTSARPPAGPSGPRSSTTSPRTPSWARWCWRTG